MSATVAVAVDDITVAGRTVELARAGEGRTVLYLHGLCADIHATRRGERWPAALQTLAEDHRVVAPALPGYGGSQDLPARSDMEDYVFHLADLCDVLGLRSVDLVASSYGGWLAAEFALRHPSRVRRLALAAPLGLHVAADPVPAFFGAVAPYGVGGFGEARRLLFAHGEAPAALEALPDDMGEDAQIRWFGGLAACARLGWPAPHFQSKAFTRRAGRIKAPLLVLRGDADQLVTAAAAASWADTVPGARVETVSGAGHCLLAERPEAATVLAEFLDTGDVG